MSLSGSDRFTLQVGHWYGLSMFPGYAACPYHSPIRVDGVRPLGSRLLELEYLNLAYAAGVQNFRTRLRTLAHVATHVVFSQAPHEARTLVLMALNRKWISRHFPSLEPEPLFDAHGIPDERALLALAANTGAV